LYTYSARFQQTAEGRIQPVFYLLQRPTESGIRFRRRKCGNDVFRFFQQKSFAFSSIFRLFFFLSEKEISFSLSFSADEKKVKVVFGQSLVVIVIMTYFYSIDVY